MIHHQPPRARPTHMSWCNSPTEHVVTNATLLVYITQPLIQPLYKFFGPNLGWNRDCDNFIPKHTNRDIAIQSKFRLKSAGKHSNLPNQPPLTPLPTNL